ncbi:MAG: alpha/beta fold hydrolase [Parvibaculaceae bacterium]
MEHFISDGVRIAYRVEGEGPPIVLVHGFASTHAVNWIEPGWVDGLVKAGREVILFDLRGHGASEKLFDVEAYDRRAMAGDIAALLDHLGHKCADIMGYSLGAILILRLARDLPGYCRRVVLAGVGEKLFAPSGQIAPVRDALLADDPRASKHAVGRAFRAFADKNGQNRQALAACYSVERDPLTPADLAAVEVPVLVVAGERDEIAGDPAPLAAAFAHGEAVAIPKRDHMRTVGDPAYKKAVLEFLGRG